MVNVLTPFPQVEQLNIDPNKIVKERRKIIYLCYSPELDGHSTPFSRFVDEVVKGLNQRGFNSYLPSSYFVPNYFVSNRDKILECDLFVFFNNNDTTDMGIQLMIAHYANKGIVFFLPIIRHPKFDMLSGFSSVNVNIPIRSYCTSDPDLVVTEIIAIANGSKIEPKKLD